MADPITTGFMVASTVISGVGAVKQSKAQKKAGKMQAAADKRRAGLMADMELQEANALAAAELAAGKAAFEMGQYTKAAADFETKQYEYNASQERATSQRAAIEERRLARVQQSRAKAVAASSGGSATDISIVNLLGDIEGYGEYDALTALFEGGERARSMETAAIVRRFEGKQAHRAGEVTRDAAQQRYLDILSSAKRRATAILQGGVDSAALARQAGNAAASATLWSGIASMAGNAATISSRFGGGPKLSYVDKSTLPKRRP